MNAKLLTDEALRGDLYIEFMYLAGTLAYYQSDPVGFAKADLREIIDRQLDMLMPVVKRHIKRRVRVAKEQGILTSEGVE